jgi:ubiquinone/menaquinone biosynthesis C-methylase UbiE
VEEAANCVLRCGRLVTSTLIWISNPPGKDSESKGDAQRLLFASNSFDLIVSSDTLEHFLQPAVVLGEVTRVLKGGARLIIWVPFLHPFHGDDYFRYPPLGLRSLMEALNSAWFPRKPLSAWPT